MEIHTLPPVGKRTFFDKMLAVYTVMENSNDIDTLAANVTTDESGNVIWQGSVAAVFRHIDLNMSEYTDIMKRLRESGSLTMLQAGAGLTKSVYVLLRQPSMKNIAPPKAQLQETRRRDKITLARVMDEINKLKIQLAKFELDVNQRMANFQRLLDLYIGVPLTDDPQDEMSPAYQPNNSDKTMIDVINSLQFGNYEVDMPRPEDEDVTDA